MGSLSAGTKGFGWGCPAGLRVKELRLPLDVLCPAGSGAGQRPGLPALSPPSRSWQCDLAAAAVSPLLVGTSGRRNDRCWAALVDANLQMNFCQERHYWCEQPLSSAIPDEGNRPIKGTSTQVLQVMRNILAPG